VKPFVILLLATLPTFSPSASTTDDTRLARSRALADQLQTALSQRLMATMADGGPVTAIDVCREEAPEIAARISAEAGAHVRRTALRVRNPANTPDADARRVLESFDARMRRGDAPPLETFEAKADGSARYMRAIVLQPMCATCHGTDIAAPVAAAIAAKYPDDRATGFAPGELRGAFIVDWAAADTPQTRH